MIDLSWTTLAVAAAAVLLAYAVFGLCGFGAGIVALPLLVHVLPLRTAVPMMLVLDMSFALALGLQNRALVERRELLRLAPWLVAGLGVGTLLLARTSESLLLGVLGAFVMANAAWSLFGRASPQPLQTGWAVPAGLVGGTFTAAYGTGGPVYTLYLARRIADTTRLRASVGTLVFVSAVLRGVLLVAGGFFAGGRPLLLALLMLPCAALGYLAGSRWSRGMPQARLRRAIWVLLLASGATLLVRSVAG